jgi:formylglycine-generating enzyme required for sulfatase activity
MADREVSVQLFNQFLTDPEYAAADKPDPAVRQTPDPVVSPSDQHPVQNVAWVEAVLFCNWLSRREGRTPCYERTGEQRVIMVPQPDGEPEMATWDAWRWNRDANGYRLPTEAEWEHACRTGTTSLFYFGNDYTLLPFYGVSSNNRIVPARACGSLIPNGWGLFDMHGNVWEWCWDWFATMSEQDETDPVGPSEPTSRFGAKRVFRGGGVANFSGDPVSSSRGMATPDNSRFRNLGFRIVTSTKQ